MASCLIMRRILKTILSETTIKSNKINNIKMYSRFKRLYPHRDNIIQDVYLRFYNGKTVKDYVDIQLIRSEELFSQEHFIPDNPTVIYIHGYEEINEQESIRVVVSAYLDEQPNTNIILLDWSNMAFGGYLTNAGPNVKIVAGTAANEIKKLIDIGLPISQLHLIGHSLGGQLSGFIGKHLLEKYNIKLRRITALDPAFPTFYPKFLFDHIDSSNAEFVDIIHTDAGFYGAPVHTGTADFWPNGGVGKQPGCPKFAPMPLSDDSLCSHWRSWRFWAESVRNPIAFPAVAAKSYAAFKRENSKLDHNPDYIYMGIKADHSATGDFYLTTNPHPPFGKGLDGVRLYRKKK